MKFANVSETYNEFCKICAHYNTERCKTCLTKDENGKLDYSLYEYISDKSKTANIKDSGERREFPTGAVRDMAKGKGSCISLPFGALLRLSKHYEAGLNKYGFRNWAKGLPVSSFMDSALRHLLKYCQGMDDEDHLSAAAFNILSAMEMEEFHPEMCDLETRKGKNTFPYFEKKEGKDDVDTCF